MCQIIQCPTNKIENTNGYKNLVALFEICDTIEDGRHHVVKDF